MIKTANASVDVAIAKAKHSATYKRDIKFHEDLLSKENNLVLSLPNGLLIEGGVQLIFKGNVVGETGVVGLLQQMMVKLPVQVLWHYQIHDLPNVHKSKWNNTPKYIYINELFRQKYLLILIITNLSILTLLLM